MSEQHPSASVVGIDISPMQPYWVPPNLEFFVDDVELDWVQGDDWDFVHFRNMSSYFRDLPKVLRNTHR